MPQLPEVPEVITSERLELRAPRLEHVAALTKAVRASLPELKPWMPWATDDYDRDGCEENVRRAMAVFVTKQDLRYHIFERRSGRLIGSTGLHTIRWEVPRCEIGYWLASSETGKGYVTEAVRALTGVAFERLGAKRVEIRLDDLNVASAAVAERCGFNLDGVLGNYTRGTDGSLRAERVYSLTSLDGLR